MGSLASDLATLAELLLFLHRRERFARKYGVFTGAQDDDNVLWHPTRKPPPKRH
jgi:hypothetical protein